MRILDTKDTDSINMVLYLILATAYWTFPIGWLKYHWDKDFFLLMIC